MVREDPRSTRSRSALIEAMAELLDSEASLESLSVTDVVRAAGVSRPTFYQHFGEMSLLVRAAALHRLAGAFADIPEVALGESWTTFVRGTFRGLLLHLQGNVVFYKKALTSGGSQALSEDVIGLLAARLLDVSPLGPILRNRTLVGSPEDRAAFLAAGTFWLVNRWLDSDFTGPDSVAAMVDRISLLLLTAAGVTDDEIAVVRAQTDVGSGGSAQA